MPDEIPCISRTLSPDWPVIFENSQSDSGTAGTIALSDALNGLLRRLHNNYKITSLVETGITLESKSGYRMRYVARKPDVIIMLALAGFLRRLWTHKKEMIAPDRVPMMEGLLAEDDAIVVYLDKDHNVVCALPGYLPQLERLGLLFAAKLTKPSEVARYLQAPDANWKQIADLVTIDSRGAAQTLIDR